MEPHRNALIIGCAIVAGAVTLLAVAIAMPFLAPVAEAEAARADHLRWLSLVHGAVFVSCLVLSFVVPARMSHAPPLQRLILRWALFEGAALLGAVVVLLAGLQGQLPGHSALYLNGLSTLALVLVVGLDLVSLASPGERD